MVIESDASTQGWGAMCGGVRTGSPWSTEERQWHINCLEALAAFHAVLCQRQERRYSVAEIGQHICCLICKQVGRDSVPQTEQHCKGPVAVVHEQRCILTAEHLLGILNTIADEEYPVMKDRSDWMLDPQVFHKIQKRWDSLEVDMFALRLTT